jgi:hypothetical protein
MVHTEELPGCQVSQGLAVTVACPHRFQARHDGRIMIRLSRCNYDSAPERGLSSNGQDSGVTGDYISNRQE